MGQFLKICEVTFCLKMANSTAILVSIFSILMIDQFSRRRKITFKQKIFCVERIDLASKLRNANLNGGGVGHFQVESPLTNFQKLTHQITLLADFTHFEQPFSLQNQKQPISPH